MNDVIKLDSYQEWEVVEPKHALIRLAIQADDE